MVRTNGTNSEYFCLHRSTRQGCPLSPLLFATVMEPLSIALRSHPDICGMTRNGVELNVALYADNLLLLFSNLSRSIPAALSVLDKFSRFSGYKLNLSKSEMFTVNGEVNENPFQLQNLPFKVVNSGFVYLGVYVAKTLVNLKISSLCSQRLNKILSDGPY